MATIELLDNNTIDKIAAGEVVERPSSVVKELVENAIDSGANIITVEIKNGGLKLIRVTDNGSGIESSQIRKAFASHATSKIRTADDLNNLFTLGFRGEALSSISAVARVEVTSKTADSLTGIHYLIEGGREIKCEEVGAPDGTTFLIRDLFFNTLPRLKFLKSEMTEANYVADLMEHLALSMPHISFQFINNGQTKFSTSGRGDLKEVIYRLFGREMSNSIRSIDVTDQELSMKVTGYLGLPRINRSNRAGEIFFINHRYVKSPIISRAVEEGYVEYLMQHKFPFCILNLEFSPEKVDVNVHPTKKEVRLSEERGVHDSLVKMISSRLSEREMIDAIELNIPEKKKEEKDKQKEPAGITADNPETNAALSQSEKKNPVQIPQQFEHNRIAKQAAELGFVKAEKNIEKANNDTNTSPVVDINQTLPASITQNSGTDVNSEDDFFTDKTEIKTQVSPVENLTPDMASPELQERYKDFKQLDFMDNEQLLSKEARRQYRIIGQVFKTYWLIEYKGSLLIMDQHAAHEKVNFEHIMARVQSRQEVPSQMIVPAAVMSLNNREKQLILENLDRFSEIGFSIEDFGEHEIVVRSIPMDLFGANPQDLITEIVRDLMEMHSSQTPDTIRTRIATMACKSAIKGNNQVSVEEIERLLDEMLTLDNPYNCPHGRPTMINITETELEKRFHRIV